MYVSSCNIRTRMKTERAKTVLAFGFDLHILNAPVLYVYNCLLQRQRTVPLPILQCHWNTFTNKFEMNYLKHIISANICMRIQNGGRIVQNYSKINASWVCEDIFRYNLVFLQYLCNKFLLIGFITTYIKGILHLYCYF